MASPLKLSAKQRVVLSDFYSKPSTKVAFNTAERREIWDEFKSHRKIGKFRYLEEVVPAIFAEINNDPKNAKSDPNTVLNIKDLRHVLGQAIEVHNLRLELLEKYGPDNVE